MVGKRNPIKIVSYLNFLFIAGYIFLFSQSSFSEDNLLSRARRYMLIHNERAYQRAEKLFSLLENRQRHYKIAYLRVKNILNWSEYYGRSKSLLMKRLISFADSLIMAAIEQYPENKDNFLLLSALSEGLKGKRRQALEKLLKLKSRFGTDSYYKYLNWKFAGYRPDPLDDTLDDIIKQNPRFFKARFDRARWYFNLGILHLATEEAGVLLAMKPRSPWVITFFGVCMLEHNDPGNAQGYFKKALSIENYSPAIFEMGRSLYLYGKLNESLPYFIRTLILDPAHLGANYYIGKAYMILGYNLKAAYHLKRYIALNPNSIDKEDVEKWITRLMGMRRT